MHDSKIPRLSQRYFQVRIVSLECLGTAMTAFLDHRDNSGAFDQLTLRITGSSFIYATLANHYPRALKALVVRLYPMELHPLRDGRF